MIPKPPNIEDWLTKSEYEAATNLAALARPARRRALEDNPELKQKLEAWFTAKVKQDEEGKDILSRRVLLPEAPGAEKLIAEVARAYQEQWFELEAGRLTPLPGGNSRGNSARLAQRITTKAGEAKAHVTKRTRTPGKTVVVGVRMKEHVRDALKAMAAERQNGATMSQVASELLEKAVSDSISPAQRREWFEKQVAVYAKKVAKRARL